MSALLRAFAATLAARDLEVAPPFAGPVAPPAEGTSAVWRV